MHQSLQNILNLIQQSEALSAEQKKSVADSIKEVDKTITITEFKLDRTEKVKKTTAILLEETIAELEQKRKAVEQQNHELEVESALERVRSVAMGMKKAEDMLEVCKTIAQQLEWLQVKEIRNVQTAIFYDEKGFYTNYEYYAKHDKLFITDTEFRNHPVAEKFATQMMKGANEVFTHGFTGKEVKDWLEYQKGTNVFIDNYLETADSLTYYWYSLGPVAMGISTYIPLKEEEINLFKRFRNVFELAYRRYLDIEKAEAQAKEARIEAALERVRARTMAMHKSEDLGSVALELFREVLKFGGGVNTSGFVLCDRNKTEDEYWVCWESGIQPPMLIPHTTDPTCVSLYKGWERGEEFYVEEKSGEELRAHFDYMMTVPSVRPVFENFLRVNGKFPSRQRWHAAYFKHGFVFVITDQPYPEEQIFKRFAPVFGQAYTRFLDLQKAEAQAREAQIEAALEKVRARTMGMQRSDELKHAAALLFQQVKALGVPAYSCGYNIWEKGENVFTSWMSTQDGSDFNAVLNIPLTEDANFIRFAESRKKDEPFFVLELRGERMQEHYQYLKTIPAFKAYFDYAVSAGFSLPETQIHHVANFSHGNLLFITLEPCPEFHDVFKRFAAVFDQTYTRFLDLQRAEAQAREGQIQLALERVRARTMAMQKSDELSEAVYILFQQFRELGENPDQATIGVINEKEHVIEYWVTMYGNQMNRVFRFSIDEPHVTNKIYHAWKEGKKSLVIDLSGKALTEFMIYRAGKGGAAVNPDEKRRIINVAFFSRGLLNVQSTQERSAESVNLLERFAAVFEQTYTRFLDLQRAEAQAREGQIQLALERVRARTMAMHRSEELADISFELFRQVQSLGVATWHCAFNIFDENENSSTEWGSNAGGTYPTYKVPREGIFQKYYEIGHTGEALHIEEIGEDRCASHYEWLCTLPGVGDQLRRLRDSGVAFPTSQIDHVAYFKYGYLIFITYESAPEAHEIFKRFAKVFEQAYTRFLDLKKAEAQARESEIQLSLERVRARTMAMQKSDELLDVIMIFADQLSKLNIRFDNVSFGVNIEDDEFKFWLAAAGLPHPLYIQVPYVDNPAPNRVRTAQRKGLKFFADVLTQEENRQWTQHLIDFSEIKSLPEMVKQFLLSSPGFARSTFILNNINLYVGNYRGEPYSDEENQIFQRFAQAFEQSYIRFLDLQKAEAQAREAQIEAALEKIRSRSLAMRKAQELIDVITVVRQKLKELNVAMESRTVLILTLQEGSKHFTQWVATPEDASGESMSRRFETPYFDHPILSDFWSTKEKGLDFFAKTYTTEEKNSFFKHIFEHADSETASVHERNLILSAGDYAVTAAIEKNSAIVIANLSKELLSEKANEILRRFARVFEQAYIRFLDLQKAEAQAREAEIELALERIRAKTMAMQKQDDLLSVTDVFFEQLVHLGFDVEIVNFSDGLSYKDWDLWVTTPTGETGRETNKVFVPWLDHPYFRSVKNGFDKYYQDGVDLNVSVFEKKDKDSFLDHIFINTRLADYSDEAKTYFYNKPGFTWSAVYLKETWVTICKYDTTPFTHEQNAILRRFANTFGQTYTRFLDLQKAEAQAREARIESALERVRSRTLAMQRSDELAETAAVLFKQLILLGIEPNRLYINLIKDEDGNAEFWITDEDGSKVSSGFVANMKNNHSFRKMYDGWKEEKKSLVIDMRGEELREYFKYLSSLNVPFKGGLTQQRRWQYIAYFSKGFIGMAAPDEQPEETMQLLERFARVFNLTFTRFNDLKIAEAHAQQAEQDLVEIKAAKKKAEDALTELQDTQKQLVQSEKMASLGELTAGIAHEIQNPLNFVNNFSDVSSELLQEMKAELEEGNKVDAIAIAEDIQQNLQKILHHGKRADAIVKSMLQHSRTSSGRKEPTDINALADEYLRLAYHGLRAKDKTFNARFESDLDPSIEKISIISQEIGRVILNLINNAFYAVSSRKSEAPDGYEPTVRVSTKKLDDKIELRVIDNGGGIPKRILDKIFQPFFTTKPAGQGTGLGLSLSYDIITKGHGGDLKVETKEGQGSEFIVQLPMT